MALKDIFKPTKGGDAKTVAAIEQKISDAQELLIGDDLSMAALQGGLGGRAAAAIDAGCDVVLHCSGKLGEMTEALSGIAPMSDVAMERLARGEALRQRSMTAAPADMADRLAALLDTTQG